MSGLFGIHFGNTSACLALCKDDDRVEVVANDTGDRLTPTTVQWTPGQCLVGRGAVVEQFRYLTSTVIWNKQLLNENICNEELEDLRSELPYKVYQKDNTVKYELLCDGKQHQVSIREITYAVFKKLYDIALTSVSGCTDLEAVLTVPLDWSPKAINIVRDIAEKVGFSVLQVIDEPSAAVLATIHPTTQSTLCLVVRIGGVSLDVTVVSIQDGMYTILSTIHKNGFCGRYITQKLRDYLASEFTRQYRGEAISERGNFKLETAAETAKQILSIQNVAQCSAESIGGGLDLNCSVSRPRLDNIVASLIPEVVASIQKALSDATVVASSIEKVILCGGTTKIPRIQETIRNQIPNAEVLGLPSPDEIIAIGAALQARCYSKAGIELPSSFAIDVPTVSKNIELKVNDANNDELSSLEIPAGTILPVNMKMNLADGGVCLNVSIEGIKETATSFPLKSSALIVHVDKDGNLRIDQSSNLSDSRVNGLPS